jgi:hypothetical protein
MAITVQLLSTDVSDKLPLYVEECGQDSRAYLHLDLEGDGEMWVDYKYPSDNSCGQREWHKVQLTYPIPNNLTPEGYNDLMVCSTVTALTARIVAGATVEWDGNNFVGSLDDDAEAAHDDLYAYLDGVYAEDFAHLEPWDAEQYYCEVKLSDIVKPGETHEAAARREVAEAERHGLYLDAVNVEMALDKKKAEEAEAESCDE